MGLHHHRWTWSEPLGLPGQQVAWCQDAAARKAAFTYGKPIPLSTIKREGRPTQ